MYLKLIKMWIGDNCTLNKENVQTLAYLNLKRNSVTLIVTSL